MLVHTFDANELPVNLSEAAALCCSLEEARHSARGMISKLEMWQSPEHCRGQNLEG